MDAPQLIASHRIAAQLLLCRERTRGQAKEFTCVPRYGPRLLRHRARDSKPRLSTLDAPLSGDAATPSARPLPPGPPGKPWSARRQPCCTSERTNGLPITSGNPLPGHVFPYISFLYFCYFPPGIISFRLLSQYCCVRSGDS